MSHRGESTDEHISTPCSLRRFKIINNGSISLTGNVSHPFREEPGVIVPPCPFFKGEGERIVNQRQIDIAAFIRWREIVGAVKFIGPQ